MFGYGSAAELGGPHLANLYADSPSSGFKPPIFHACGRNSTT
jgi:hypothetical protein